MNEREAIQRLKSGDIGGLEVLVRTYQVKAIRAAFFITQNEAIAEDIVQETFIRLYHRIQQFDESRPFESYLMRSVINASLKTLRRSRKIVSLDGNPALVKRLLSEVESVESQVELDELSHRLLDTLSQLSPRQRAVIIQRYYLEMSEEEMSQTLDIAPGTVKWHLNAARTRLRVLLGSERRSQ